MKVGTREEERQKEREREIERERERERERLSRQYLHSGASKAVCAGAGASFHD